MRLLPLIVALAFAPAAGAQTSPQAALDRCFAKADLMIALSDQQWHPELAMTAGALTVGDHLTLRLTARPGKRLVIIATTEAGTDDVDLYLRDARGRPLARDTAADATPVIEWTALGEDTLDVQVHLVAGDQRRKFVALSVLSNEGVGLTKETYRAVSEAFFASSTGPAAASASPAGWSVWVLPISAVGTVYLSDLPRPAPDTELHVLSYPSSKGRLSLVDDQGRELAGGEAENEILRLPPLPSGWGVFYQGRTRHSGWLILGLRQNP